MKVCQNLYNLRRQILLIATFWQKLEAEQRNWQCFILNAQSAERGAVLAVETMQWVGEKGIKFWYPSACSSRRFYLAPKQASIMAANIDISNMDWEDFAGQIERNGVFHGFH
ncbi:TPA: hypothetical protein ACH3X3_000461 [Trebouxia sp. C0006]